MIVLYILVLIILIFNIKSTVNVFMLSIEKKDRLNLLRLTYFSTVLRFLWKPVISFEEQNK